MPNTAADRLKSLGLELPPAPNPVANYVPALRTGNLLFVSGQIARRPDGSILAGTLGADLDIAQGQEAARICALNILAQAAAALESLDRIGRLVRLNGFVAATPDFKDHPSVINGASDLMVDVLGEKGRHTRAAIGVASLPAGTAVEIDAIFALDES